jgi:N6-L-threonylcarbamoyladenine synthase
VALTVLGIESSCDETAAALVRRDDHGRPHVLAERLLSQIEEHRPYQGVVPEIAARAHLAHLDGLIASAVESAGIDLAAVDGVAATGGPGLIGGVMVGVTMAKAIAAVHAKPFVAVNHLEGHALSARLVERVAFPYLLLLVSGGHCQLVVVRGVGDYRQLGTTIDDAVGEAFDKVAKLLGLGYPGGPAVEAAAATATAPERFPLPRPL